MNEHIRFYQYSNLQMYKHQLRNTLLLDESHALDILRIQNKVPYLKSDTTINSQINFNPRFNLPETIWGQSFIFPKVFKVIFLMKIHLYHESILIILRKNRFWKSLWSYLPPFLKVGRCSESKFLVKKILTQ